MKIIVTGCFGFIGTNLCLRLLNEGHEVLGVDKMIGYDKNDNYSALINYKNFSWLCSVSSLNSNNVSGTDAVVHLAAVAGVQDSMKNPLKFVNENVKTTTQLLEKMRKLKMKNLVFASSSSVYGGSNELNKPFVEDISCTQNPLSPYSFSKKSCELINSVYNVNYGISVINLRFFTVYGERQRPDLAINKIFKCIKNSSTFEIYGDGSSYRDYTYIEDIVDGIIKSVQLLDSSKDAIFSNINLGSGRPISLIDLLRTIEKISDSKIKVEKIEFKNGDMLGTYCDNKKALSILGWEPKYTLEQGLIRYKQWLDDKGL